MEYSPTPFVGMSEEDLRTHFLVHLNGHFPGQATAETFNFSGKTDIIMKAEGRNVFIAECKIWHGTSALLGTLDQLLRYISWRDTKAAALMFNRNSNFTEVLSAIEVGVPTHPKFIRMDCKTDESTFQYILVHPQDPNRELMVTVVAFNIPTRLP